MEPIDDLRHVANTLHEMSGDLECTRYTRAMLSLLAAKLGGLAVLADVAIDAIDRQTTDEWGMDDRIGLRDELVTQELPEEERHHAN